MPHISKKQIEQTIDVISVMSSSYALQVTDMLQSLLDQPEVEPVAYLAHWHIEPTMHSEADDGLEIVEPSYENAFPVYTHPPAPRKFTAENIRLMAFNDCSDDWNRLDCRESWLDGYVSGAAAVNAYLGANK